MKISLKQTKNNFLKQKWIDEFKYGLRQGTPIALGYIPVSFTFGLIAVKGGLPVWIPILISLTNLTSAGQFAGTNLIISGAALFEIAVTTFVINIRYLLMSLSLSQKITPQMPLYKKCAIAFGITDEIFSVASMEKQDLTFAYMSGLITGPFIGWVLGTALGASICSVLPGSLQDSTGIALYAMFIALIIPNAKKSLAALTVVIIAISLSSIFTWVPYINQISEGWGIIIATMISCLIGAALFPREDV